MTKSNASKGMSDLATRLVPAVLFSALAGSALIAGGVYFTLLIALMVAVMVWEFFSMCYRDTVMTARCLSAVIALPAAAAFMVIAVYDLSASMAYVSTAALLVVCLLLERYLRGSTCWSFGLIYLIAAGIACIQLRADESFGLLIVLWCVLIVVSMDVGAYFTGRHIGGAKMWPAVSPNKTWAGLVGGGALAFLVGCVFSWQTSGTYFEVVSFISALIALISQGGDLAISAMKRHFGVKDTGKILPGHGGVLDRLDGHLPAILVVWVLTVARGQPIYIW